MSHDPDKLLARADGLALDVDAVKAAVERVLTDKLYWFPVRHHSPTAAKLLERAMQTRRPKIVFIEGPTEAQDVIPHIVDSATKPPVAIYSSFRDDDNVTGLAGVASPAADVPPRFAVWFPMTAYSPEYIALKTASKLGCQAMFMDLPHYGLLTARLDAQATLGEDDGLDDDDADTQNASHSAIERRRISSSATPSSSPPNPPPNPAAGGAPPAPETPTNEADDDEVIESSSFYQALAKSAGYRTWDEGWDALFEFGPTSEDVEAFRAELTTFCAAVRATTPSRRIEIDGTLARERFMLRTIRETLAAKNLKPEDAMVVCGGFHVFLDQNDPEPPPTLPHGTVFATLAPYSFFRISELSGYAAGCRAPQFYQAMWDLERDERPDDLLVEYVTLVLKHTRKHEELVSSADAIAICQHARLLGRLRGRERPVLDDMHDAIITCCCKGDPKQEGRTLLKAIDEVDVGTKIGKVTSAIGYPPIVNDYRAQLEALNLQHLEEKENRLKIVLNKQDPFHARQSAFLHRLVYLGIPIGEQTRRPSTTVVEGTIFKEEWALRWSPSIFNALLEKQLFGDTIEAASLALLKTDLSANERDAGKACRRLMEAVDMDLTGLTQIALDACGHSIDEDSRLTSLADAVVSLTIVERRAIYRGVSESVLADLIERAFDRACFALPDAANVPPEETAQVIGALQSMAGLVLQGSHERLDRDLFAEQVSSAAATSESPFLRGAFLGLLAELRVLTPDDLADEVRAFAMATRDEMVKAGDFIDGVLAVSRSSILLGADSLVGAIDSLLQAAQWEDFLIMLPRLRSAFERLHERQRESVAERVAIRFGLAQGAAQLTSLNTSVAAGVWIAQIDAQVAEIMKEWNF